VVVPGLLRSQAGCGSGAIREEPPSSSEIAADSVRLFRKCFP
jgi:hypothetical protein